MKMKDGEDNASSEDSQLSEKILIQSPCNQIKQFFLGGMVKTIHKQENTNVILMFNFVCQMLCLIHIFIVQQILSGEQGSTFLVQIFNPQSTLSIVYRILQIYSITMKLIIIQLIFVELVYGSQIIGFSWLNKKISESFYIIKKVDLTLSGYLLLFSWSQNIPIYLASLGIQVFYALYIQNYIFRKDVFYATSSLHYIIWTTTISSLYGINIILLNIGNYFLFTVIHLLLGSITMIWYSRCGEELFANNLVRTTYLVMTALYGSFFIGLAEQLSYGTSLFTVQCIFKLIFSFLLIALVLKLIGNRQSSFIQQDYGGQLKQYELFAFKLLEESYIHKQAESLIMGILYTHICAPCINQKCPYLKDKIFDPIIKMEIVTKEIHAQRDTSLRLYFKCLYEYKISESPLSKKIKLEYSDFLYNETGNMYLLMNQLVKIQNMNLNVIQKVRVNKLKLLIAEENIRLNNQLYNGKLDLEHIINSQQVFSTIERDIRQYLHQNLIVWKNFSESQIDLSLLRNKISDNFKIIDRISASWKKISKYLNIHKEWKFVYLTFMLFLRNDKTRQKQLDQACRSNKNVLINNKELFQETKLQRELFMPSFLYDRESFCIKTVLEENSLVIKDVSKYFQKNTHYTLVEIKGVHLSTLMPEQIRQKHEQTVLKWIEQGYQADYKSYSISFTHLLNKEGQQFPVLKYYKIFFNLENGLVEFICLLKKNMSTQGEEVDSTDQQIYQYKNIPSQDCGRVSAMDVEQEFNHFQNENQFVQGNNIFLKQQTLVPSQRFQVIQRFKLSSRIYTVVILASIIILALTIKSDINIISNYGVQFINFMKMFRFPVILGTNYIKSFMNVGSASAVRSQIQLAAKSMQLYSSQQTTIQTLFDPVLNIPTRYYPHQYYVDTSLQSYDQIDIFYVIMSSISSLNTPSINRTSQEFKQFNAFLKPAYITMINSTRYQFHYTIQAMFASIQTRIIVFIIVQTVLFFIFIMIIFYYVHSALTKMKNIFAILIDFRQNDVQKITNYWIKINRSFRNIFCNMQGLKQGMQTSRLSYQSIISQSNIKAASNSKFKIVQGKVHRQYQFILRVLIVCTTVIILLLAMSAEIDMIVTNRNLSSFEADGFNFLQYFPIAAIVGYGCMQKYYSINYPSQISFDPNRYANDLSILLAFGNPNYSSSIKDTSSAYYQKQKNYFFRNICVYNSAPLNTTTVNITVCQTISNGTFKEGLSAFLRYEHNIASSYLNGRTLMTPTQLQQLTLSSTVLSAYVLDALSTWQAQFTSRLQVNYQNITTISIIILIFICLAHFIVNESIIKNKISEEYQFCCKMYEYMVPEYILINQKVIRQKFILEELIGQ